MNPFPFGRCPWERLPCQVAWNQSVGPATLLDQAYEPGNLTKRRMSDGSFCPCEVPTINDGEGVGWAQSWVFQGHGSLDCMKWSKESRHYWEQVRNGRHGRCAGRRRHGAVASINLLLLMEFSRTNTNNEPKHCTCWKQNLDLEYRRREDMEIKLPQKGCVCCRYENNFCFLHEVKEL